MPFHRNASSRFTVNWLYHVVFSLAFVHFMQKRGYLSNYFELALHLERIHSYHSNEMEY